MRDEYFYVEIKKGLGDLGANQKNHQAFLMCGITNGITLMAQRLTGVA